MDDKKQTLVPAVEGVLNSGEALVAAGNTMMKFTNLFGTAIRVQVERELSKVIRRCEEEAMLAGDDFYYSWSVKGEGGKTGLVEGPGVELAHAAMRNWGNCGVSVSVEDTGDAWIFYAMFTDLETGSNLVRAFRQRKKVNIGKKMDEDRALDIAFQIGQSKATRNVIVNYLPKGLVDKMMAQAKSNVVSKIEKMGIAQAKEKIVSLFARYAIDVPRLEAKLERKESSWTAEQLALLNGAYKSLIDGIESPDSLFPQVGGEFKIDSALRDRFNVACDTLKINTGERNRLLGSVFGNDKALESLVMEYEKKAPSPTKTTEASAESNKQSLGVAEAQVKVFFETNNLDEKKQLAIINEALGTKLTKMRALKEVEYEMVLQTLIKE